MDLKKACIIGSGNAEDQILNRPIFPEQERYGRMNADERAAYEVFMGKLTGKATRLNQSEAVTNVSKYMEDNGYGPNNPLTGIIQAALSSPRDTVPQKIHKATSEKLDLFQSKIMAEFQDGLRKIESSKIDPKQKGRAVGILRSEAKATYFKEFAPQFKKAVDVIENAFQSGDNKKITLALNKLGLKRGDVYTTYNWLKWLEGGGPWFDKNNQTVWENTVANVVSNTTGNKMAFNLRVAVLNANEALTKGFGLYGVRNMTKAVAEMVKATGGNPLKQLPELQRKGVYNNDLAELRGRSKYDPVQMSQTVLENLSYFLGKVSDGDYKKALREVAYKDDPWNIPYIQMASTKNMSRAISGLMRYQYMQNRQYLGWFKEMLKSENTMKQRAVALKKWATYTAVQTLITGLHGSLPAPVYLIPGVEEGTETIDKNVPIFNMVKKVTGIDLGRYTRPVGGFAVGVMYDVFNAMTTDVGASIKKAMEQANKGNPVAAAANVGKAVLDIGAMKDKEGPNALMLQTAKAIAKTAEDEAGISSLPYNMIESIFGKGSGKAYKP